MYLQTVHVYVFVLQNNSKSLKGQERLMFSEMSWKEDNVSHHYILLLYLKMLKEFNNIQFVLYPLQSLLP